MCLSVLSEGRTKRRSVTGLILPGLMLHKERWGDGLTAEERKKCVWARPELVAQIEFLEWT